MDRQEFENRVKRYASQIFTHAKSEMSMLTQDELAEFWRKSFILLEQNDLKELREYWKELKLAKTIVVLDRLILEIDFIKDEQTIDFGPIH
jgi:hypothetical protein